MRQYLAHRQPLPTREAGPTVTGMALTMDAKRDDNAQWWVPVWTLGDRLRKAREGAGLEQSAIADDLGVSRRSVGNWECGHVVPKRATLLAWALRTGVPVWWLEGAEEPQQDSPAGAHRLPRLDLNQRPSD